MKTNACTGLELHLIELSLAPGFRWLLRRLLWRCRQGHKRLAGLLSTALSVAILGGLYFFCLTLFLVQLAEHGW